MSDIPVVPATDTDRYLQTDKIVWFDTLSPDSYDAELGGVPADQRFAVDLPDGPADAYAAIYGVRPMRLGVPGGRAIDAAGLTWVGVHPDHRRKGLLTAMLHDHFVRTREAGLAVSALHASEGGIYGRHGYGVAGREISVTLGSGTKLKAPHLDEAAGRLRTEFRTTSDEGLADRLLAVAEHLVTHESGAIVFEPGFYRTLLFNREADLLKNEPMRVLFAVEDGRDVGVARFGREHKWERGRPQGKLEVYHLAGTPAARLALLRRLLDFDLMGSVKVHGVGVEDPLWWWLAEREGADNTLLDSAWVRIIDLPAAVAARGYEGSGDVVVEVDDPQLPDNAGRWRITVSDGAGRAERSTDDADISLPVSVLGSAYLGGANLTAMLRAGVLSEHRAGAVSELSRAFRTEVAPAASPGF